MIVIGGWMIVLVAANGNCHLTLKDGNGSIILPQRRRKEKMTSLMFHLNSR
jgi:hypothetical protein